MDTNISDLNAYIQVREYDNEILRSLLKEIRCISKMNIPRNAKHSPNMKTLFQVEKTRSNYWSDQYHNVKSAIELEILSRVLSDII